MDVDQLLKRVQWIEDDRRKEKDTLALLENRVASMEGGISALSQQIKELGGEITRLSTVITRMDQYDNTILQQRIEAKRMVEDLGKELRKSDDEAVKVRQVELRAIDANINELRKQIEVLPKLEKGLQVRFDEEVVLRRAIEETRSKIDEVRREDEEYTRTFRLLEDGRRQDSKRILDLQGELTALRKRADDQRGQIELLNNGLRKTETRINELVTVEAERRDSVSNFLDKQNLTQVERERVWKEWQSRFETVEKQATDIEATLLNLDTTQREVKRGQGILEELSQRVDRRINEITEIQRLSEDRFKQEWVTFKADDQKRWTNYTLTQEEQRDEVLRQFEKFSERVTQQEDGLQELQDLLNLVKELSEKRMQTLLALVHEWVSTYERTVGKSRS
jgi:DNA repair exonuclease SbcCD ATPase subunit